MRAVSHPRYHTHGVAGAAAAGHGTGPTGAGSVLLELGGDIGALVLHTPARLHGTEIEISPSGAGPHSRRTHSLVRERVTAAGVGYAAVYPQVPADRYTIWGEDGLPVGTTVISGGQVTSFFWPE